MMNKSRNKKSAIVLMCAAVAVAAVIIMGKECSQGALNGIVFCLNVLVPSIFPFMTIAMFIAESGLSKKAGKITSAICKKLFGVSGNLSAVIILSLIGGYPVGARGISALRNNGAISEYDAVKASYFAVGAGPGFLITFVGSNLLSSKETGLCIFFAQIISVIILGFVNKLVFAGRNTYNSYKENNAAPLPFSSAVTKAVTSSTYAVLEMCGMVVVFSAIIAIFEKLFPDANTYISVLLEVTTACNTLAQSNNIPVIAFAAGFGGICVHFQIFTALKNIGVNKALFFLYRIMQGIITALFSVLFIKAFRISLPVFSSIGTMPELSLSTSAAGSVMLILCGAGFIYSIKRL